MRKRMSHRSGYTMKSPEYFFLRQVWTGLLQGIQKAHGNGREMPLDHMEQPLTGFGVKPADELRKNASFSAAIQHQTHWRANESFDDVGAAGRKPGVNCIEQPQAFSLVGRPGATGPLPAALPLNESDNARLPDSPSRR